MLFGKQYVYRIVSFGLSCILLWLIFCYGINFFIFWKHFFSEFFKIIFDLGLGLMKGLKQCWKMLRDFLPAILKALKQTPFMFKDLPMACRRSCGELKKTAFTLLGMNGINWGSIIKIIIIGFAIATSIVIFSIKAPILAFGFILALLNPIGLYIKKNYDVIKNATQKVQIQKEQISLNEQEQQENIQKQKQINT